LDQASSNASSRGPQRLIERHKELDHAHLALQGRRVLPSPSRLVLSLGFARQFLRQLFTQVERPTATVVAPPAPGTLKVTMVGHASVMFTSPQARVLTDPCFAEFVWGMRRAVAATIDAADLAAVDLVLISHAHLDHLHPPSLQRLPRTATVLVPPGCADLVEPLGFAQVIELEPGTAHAHRDLEITAVPARHDGRRGPHDPRWRGALGYVIRSPGVTAYFAGDTAYYSGFRDLGARHRPDVALLPIAGYLPLELRETHMSPLDAIAAFEELGAQLLVPISHGAFPLGYEGIAAPAAWLTTLAEERGLKPHVRLLGSGETCWVRRPLSPLPTARDASRDPG
jgi:L-ascorbate metabolism protein UlaG (beta-lactamase superfamily)